MKKLYFLLFSLLCFSFSNAQFLEDFEDCTGNGDPYSTGHWTVWGCSGGVGCAIVCSSDQAHNGTYSGLIPDDNTTDAVLDLGNKIFGIWCFDFWMYVPSGKEAYWNLQGTVPIGTGEWIVGNVFFNQDNVNPGVGLIDDSALGPINFNFPHDEWFRIIMSWDISTGISLATWEFYVDFNEVIPYGTPFTNEAGDIPTSLGGVNFFSISTDNWYYLDDFDFDSTINNKHCSYLDILDIRDTEFLIYPNPVEDILKIENASNIEVESVIMYDVLGRLVMVIEEDLEHIDVSNLESGIFFITLTTEIDVITKKLVKE